MTEKIVSVNKSAVRRKARRAGKRVAGYVSKEAASKGRAAKGRAEQAGRRAAGAMSQRVASTKAAVRRKASRASRSAAAKLLEVGIELSRRQQAALEKLKTRI